MKIKYESSAWLFNEYQQENSELLMIDCRPFCDYSSAHIEGAINISVPTMMLRRLKKGNVPLDNFFHSDIAKEKFERRSCFDKVIIYDQMSCSNTAKENSLLEFLQIKLTEDCSVVTLNGGFVEFERSFPHLCHCGEGGELGNAMFSLANLKLHSDSQLLHDQNNNKSFEFYNAKELLFRPESSGPIEIVPQLYLGNKTDSSSLDLLKMAQITHILNVTHDLPNVFEDNPQFEYLKLPVQDNWNGNMIALLPLACAFIDRALEDGGHVLVHCFGGISRSSTVIIAYLMTKHQMSLNDAFDHVKNKKQNIAPNFNFMGQLSNFEESNSQPHTPYDGTPGSVSPAVSIGSTSSTDSNGSC